MGGFHQILKNVMNWQPSGSPEWMNQQIAGQKQQELEMQKAQEERAARDADLAFHQHLTELGAQPVVNGLVKDTVHLPTLLAQPTSDAGAQSGGGSSGGGQNATGSNGEPDPAAAFGSAPPSRELLAMMMPEGADGHIPITRKADSSRMVKFKDHTGEQVAYELPEVGSQVWRKLMADRAAAQAQGAGAVAQATTAGQESARTAFAGPAAAATAAGNIQGQTEGEIGARQSMLRAFGVPIPDDVAETLGYPRGLKVLPQEIPTLQENAQKVKAGNRLVVSPGQTVYDISGHATQALPQAGGAPRPNPLMPQGSTAPQAAAPGAEPTAGATAAPSGSAAPGQPPVIASGGSPLPTDDFGKYFLPAFAQANKTTPDELKKNPQLMSQAFQQYAEVKADPAVRASLLATRGLQQQLQQIQLNQQPKAEDAQGFAQDVVNHRMAPSQIALFGGFGTAGQAFKRMVMTEAKKIDPNFNMEEAESEYQLARSPGFQQTVKYMDYVGSSIGNVIRSADTLANGKVRSINALVNAGKDQFNNVNLARFNTDRLEVSDAIAKILQGGGTGSGTSDMKLKQAQDLIRSSDDPAVVRTTLGEIQSLISNRRKTLTRGTFMENNAPPAESASPQLSIPTPPGSIPKGAQIKYSPTEKAFYYSTDGKPWQKAQ